MKNPDSPFLEFGFYFQGIRPLDAFLLVARKIVSHQPVKLYNVSATPGTAAGNGDTPSVGDGKFIDVPINSFSDLESVLVLSRIEVPRLMLSGLLDIERNAYEFVVLSPHSNSNGSVVSVWSDGAWTSTGSGLSEKEQKSRKKKAHRLFRDLVLLLSPSYAAITVEYSLEAPEQLRSDSRSLAFSDFYLSEKYISSSITSAFATNFSSFRQESVGNGCLFFCPSHVSSQIRSKACEFVAKEIAMSGSA